MVKFVSVSSWKVCAIFLLINFLKIISNRLGNHSGQILCDIQPPITQNKVNTTAHNIPDYFLYITSCCWFSEPGIFLHLNIVRVKTEGRKCPKVNQKQSMEALHWENLFLLLGQSTWDIFLVEKTNIGNNQKGVITIRFSIRSASLMYRVQRLIYKCWLLGGGNIWEWKTEFN